MKTMTENNGYAVKERMLGACERRRGYKDVPGIGRVHIQSMTERERNDIEQAIAKGDGSTTIRSQVIAKCQIDDEGNRLWGDHELETIAGMDSAVTNAVFDAIDEFVSRGLDVEEAEKN